MLVNNEKPWHENLMCVNDIPKGMLSGKQLWFFNILTFYWLNVWCNLQGRYKDLACSKSSFHDFKICTALQSNCEKP